MLALVIVTNVNSLALTSQRASKDSLNVIDMMPAFCQNCQKAETADDDAKASLFRETVIAPHQSIFEGFTGTQSDADLAGYIKKVQRLLPRMHKLSDRFLADFLKYRQSFNRAFPDMKADTTVCFMPNFGVTDAGTGNLEGKSYLIFGIDTIAAQHGEDANLATLFHHELFHVYHAQQHREWQEKNRSKGEIPLYWLLWSEGLATYVSRVLNPEASLDQVLLSKTLAKEADPALAQLAKDVREHLLTTSTDYMFDYLSTSPRRKEIPPRAGYYLGMLIAQELGRTRSPARLARLGGDELLSKMRAVLLKLERAGKP
jgi:hypothetical protein